MQVLEEIPGLEPRRGKGGKEGPGGTQGGPAGENQEGGSVQCCSPDHLVALSCFPIFVLRGKTCNNNDT